MRNPILFSIFTLLLFSCNKNKYTSAPQLSYKSVNTKVLSFGQTLTFTLSFTDAEGDIVWDTALYVQKFIPKCPASSFFQYYPIPNFPTGKNQSGDITVSYTYPSQNFLGPQCKNDTGVFKFVLRDKAKNKSDTVTSPTIIIIK